jgi:diguanylate cyclase (GGDEF)-like protein
LGGDEFICLLDDIASAEAAGEVATKIIQALSMMKSVGGKNVRVGASIGVALFPDDAKTSAELKKCADMAMYSAKHAGKNCWKLARDSDGAAQPLSENGA